MAELISNKQILWYKKKLKAFSGKMTVTDTQFSFFVGPKWALAFGLIGALLATKAKGTTLVDDEIKNLKFAKGRTVGKKAYMLTVTRPDGETFDFLVDDKIMDQVKSVITLS
jgi:hypothetical protein